MLQIAIGDILHKAKLKALTAVNSEDVIREFRSVISEFRCLHCKRLFLKIGQIDNAIMQAKCPKCNSFNILRKTTKGFEIICYKENEKRFDIIHNNQYLFNN